MVEDGLAVMDDLLEDRITALKAERETSAASLARAVGENRPPIVIPTDRTVEFSKLMQDQLTSGDIKFRKAYFGATIDRVEVADGQIRIRG